MARRRKISEERTTLQLGELTVPVRIITEAGRFNWRASITGNALFVRLPYGGGKAANEDYLREIKRWARELHARDPATFEQFRRVPLATHYTFTDRDTTYAIEVVDHELRSHRISEPAPGRLLIRLNQSAAGDRAPKVIEKLLAKFLGAKHLPRVSARVHALNDRHFRRPVSAVKLSDTYTRWGSCSTKGNINLSTRLVLAPEPVLDAVIIHELAHLIEHNHGPRFWELVAGALPNYREFDEWLAREGPGLRFLAVPR